MLYGNQHLFEMPGIPFLPHAHEQLAVRPGTIEQSTPTGIPQRLAQCMDKKLLGRQEAGFLVVAGIADDDALVVADPSPFGRIVNVATQGIGDVVPPGIDPVGFVEAQRQPDRDHDVGRRACQRMPCNDVARQPDLIRPHANLDLGEGGGIGLDRLGDKRIGDLVAEFVRMTRQYGFSETDHEGTPSSWV